VGHYDDGYLYERIREKRFRLKRLRIFLERFQEIKRDLPGGDGAARLGRSRSQIMSEYFGLAEDMVKAEIYELQCYLRDYGEEEASDAEEGEQPGAV